MPKIWKFKKVDKFRDLWAKGSNPRKDDFIMIDKATPISLKYNPKDKYEVTARRKINPSTISGHHLFFTNKRNATLFVQRYLRKF
jgi:hypothetical protein